MDFELKVRQCLGELQCVTKNFGRRFVPVLDLVQQLCTSLGPCQIMLDLRLYALHGQRLSSLMDLSISRP